MSANINTIVGLAAQTNLKEFAHRFDNIQPIVDSININNPALIFNFKDVEDTDYVYKCAKEEFLFNVKAYGHNACYVMYNWISNEFMVFSYDAYAPYTDPTASTEASKRFIMEQVKATTFEEVKERADMLDLTLHGYILDKDDKPLFMVKGNLPSNVSKSTRLN